MIVLSVIPVTMNGKDMVFSVFDIEWENNKAHQRMLQRVVAPRDRINEIEEMVRSHHPMTVAIDAVAAGPAFIDSLVDKKIPICRIYPDGAAIDNMSFSDRRSELYFRMIAWLKRRKGIKLKRNDNYIEQSESGIGELMRKGGKWCIESRESLAEKGVECDEFDANAFCFIKDDEWGDDPGILMISKGRTKEYGRYW